MVVGVGALNRAKTSAKSSRWFANAIPAATRNVSCRTIRRREGVTDRLGLLTSRVAGAAAGGAQLNPYDQATPMAGGPATPGSASKGHLQKLAAEIDAAIAVRSERSPSRHIAYRMLGFDPDTLRGGIPAWLEAEADSVAAEAVPQVRERLRRCHATVVGDAVWVSAAPHSVDGRASQPDPRDVALRIEWLAGCDHVCGSREGRCTAVQRSGTGTARCAIPGLTWYGDPSAVSLDDTAEDIVTELEQLLRPPEFDLTAERWLTAPIAAPTVLGL